MRSKRRHPILGDYHQRFLYAVLVRGDDWLRISPLVAIRPSASTLLDIDERVTRMPVDVAAQHVFIPIMTAIHG